MAITGDYNLYQPYNSFGSLTYGQNTQSNGYHQANAWQGVPNTTPQVIGGFPATEDMQLAEKIAGSKIASTSNPFGINAIKTPTNEMTYVTRPQSESRELENSDISGSHLGKTLDLQGCENKAWG